MSKVLMIRHLPAALTLEDKEKLLKHFGAEKVWETPSKRNYIFASFANVDIAKLSLTRLHQLEIGQRRLVVEYSCQKEPLNKKKLVEHNSLNSQQVKEFLRQLNAWNPSVDFYQPPPVHLKYSYPKVTPKTIVNVIYALFSHHPFYTQVLHLMNKMSLEAPFSENDKAVEFFKNTFREFFIDEIGRTFPIESEAESELSSDETKQQREALPMIVKRKHTLPKMRKRAAAVLSTATLPKAKRVVLNQHEIFENTTPIQEPKKISLIVHQDMLQKQSEETEVVGQLGKFQKEEKLVIADEQPVELEQPTITKKELMQNRISYREMKILPVFKNYHPGQPSMRLYIKNLSKTVTEQDVKRIYRRYIEDLTDEQQIGFDVRVMQEGRMKGQAFVTFPSVKISEKALNETNGFILKDKPMIVQFARAANKKSID